MVLDGSFFYFTKGADKHKSHLLIFLYIKTNNAAVVSVSVWKTDRGERARAAPLATRL